MKAATNLGNLALCLHGHSKRPARGARALTLNLTQWLDSTAIRGDEKVIEPYLHLAVANVARVAVESKIQIDP